MGGNASKVGFEAIVKQLSTKEVNPTDYEVSQNHFICSQPDGNVIFISDCPVEDILFRVKFD